MLETLSVCKSFYDQPSMEAIVESDISHVEEVDLYDEDFLKFIQSRSLKYKDPIEIPRIEMPTLEEPLVDQVYIKDVLFTKLTNCETIFPEDTYVSLYKKSLKFATLESFLDDQWSEDYRNKAQSFYKRFGIQDLNDATTISKILSVTKQNEYGLKVIRFGAERRDESLVEFTQFDIYNLRLQDKFTLLGYAVKSNDFEIVTEVRRVLGIYLRNLIKHDFQLGLERGLLKLNLLERIEFDSVLDPKVFTVPELGFSYKINSRSRVFLVSDIPKYSTSTLNWISEKVEESVGLQKLKDEISFLINERIRFRELVRRLYTSGHTRINSIRENDYLLSNCYDFAIHVKDQKIQFEEFQESELAQNLEIEASEKRKEEMAEEGKEHSETGSKKMLSEAETVHSQRIEEHAFTLFLEYIHPEIFVETEQRFNFIDCWLDKSFEWKVTYSKFIQATKKSLNLIRSDYKIVKVLDADMRSKMNFRYAFYKVQRENGEECLFTEADFQNMELRDLLRVYSSLNPFADRITRFRKTFAVIKDGLYRKFIWAARKDFQVAYILKKEKVFLLRPNFNLPGIEGLKKGTLMINPPGLVGEFVGQKLFIRLEELHKCCNGTLLKVKEKVEKRLTRRPKRLSDADWGLYKNLGKSFIQKIDHLFEYRRLILEDVFQILIEWKYDLSF